MNMKSLFASLLALGLAASLVGSSRAAAGDSDTVRRWLQGHVDAPGVKLVVVDFYAEWCEPCIEAVPAWERLRRQTCLQHLAAESYE